MNNSPSQKTRTGRVAKVLPGTNHRYGVVHLSDIEKPVTFSIDSPVWEEDTAPVVGAQVVLSDIRKMDGGWRAFKARFYRPEDTLSEVQK